MSRLNAPFILLISLAVVFLLPQKVFSESIQDGILMREGSPITLKNGSVVECERFFWLVSTADYIQYDKGGLSNEIPVDEVDMEKTFGPEIAKEYAEAEAGLKKEYQRIKQEREDGDVSVEEVSPSKAGKKEAKPPKKKKEAVVKKPVKKEPEKTSASDSKAKVKKDTAKKKKAEDKKKKSTSKKK